MQTFLRFVLTLMCVLIITEAHIRKPCTKSFNCNTEEDPVYATDEFTCQIYRNECYLKSENCKRYGSYRPELKKISEEKCKPKCPRFCPLYYAPMCAIYRGGKAEFSNECFMEKHNCLSGETYVKSSNSSCSCFVPFN